MIAEKVAELAVSSCAMRAKILAVPPFLKKKKKNTFRGTSHGSQKHEHIYLLTIVN